MFLDVFPLFLIGSWKKWTFSSTPSQPGTVQADITCLCLVTNNGKKGWNLQGGNLDLTQLTNLSTCWVSKALVYVILIRSLLDRHSCPSFCAFGDPGPEMNVTQLLQGQGHCLNTGLCGVYAPWSFHESSAYIFKGLNDNCVSNNETLYQDIYFFFFCTARSLLLCGSKMLKSECRILVYILSSDQK